MMTAVTDSPGLVGFITINIDPVLHIGPIPIHWYGVMYALAFLAAYQFGVLPYARRRGLPKAVAEKICVWTIIFGLLGGRLYYVVQQPNLWHDYVLDPINIIAFWQGGMAFFGARGDTDTTRGSRSTAGCSSRSSVSPSDASAT